MMLLREPRDFFVIECFGFLVYAVADKVIQLAGEVDRRAMREMPTLG